MGRSKKRDSIWSEPPFLVGISLTLVVFAIGWFALSSGEMCDEVGRCQSKWDALLRSPPNEIGDALAGFAGTLAFIWLVVTVWLQATELREQRNEFEKMANAQEEQVSLLVQQGEIFADEQRQRLEVRCGKLLEQKLLTLQSEIERSLNFFIIAYGQSSEFTSIFSASFRHRASGQNEFATYSYADLDVEVYFSKRLQTLTDKLEQISDQHSVLELRIPRGSLVVFNKIRVMFEELNVDGLGADQLERLNRIKVHDWIVQLKRAGEWVS